MISLRKDRKGMVFITVMVLSMLMIFIAISASNMMLQDTYMIKRLKYSTQARFIAEAGISDALVTLAAQGGLGGVVPGQFLSHDMGGGMSYAVTVSTDGGRYLFSSEGVISEDGNEVAKKTAAVEIEDFTATSLNYGMSAGTDLKVAALVSLVDINGDAHANNAVRLRATVADLDVYGTATATNDYVYASVFKGLFFSYTIAIDGTTYSAPPGSPVWRHYTHILGDETGEEEFIAPLITFPQFDYGSYREMARDSQDIVTEDPCYWDGKKTFSGETLTPGAGIVYVKGKATFNGTCHLYGGIIADELDIRGNLYQHASGFNRNVIISRKGDISVRGRLETDNAMVYAGRDFKSVTALAIIDIEGNLIAQRDVNVWDFITYVDYTHEAVTLEDLIPFRVVSWNR